MNKKSSRERRQQKHRAHQDDQQRAAKLRKANKRFDELSNIRRNLDDAAYAVGSWWRTGAVVTVILWAVLSLGLTSCARVDPLLGVNSYWVCPVACDSCHGRWRINSISNTRMNDDDDDGRSTVSHFYCPSAANGIAEMTELELDGLNQSSDAYKVTAAAHASNLLVLLVLVLLYTPVPYRRNQRWREKKLMEIDEELRHIAETVGKDAPTGVPALDERAAFVHRGRFVSGAILMGAATGGSLLTLLGDLFLF